MAKNMEIDEKRRDHNGDWVGAVEGIRSEGDLQNKCWGCKYERLQAGKCEHDGGVLGYCSAFARGDQKYIRFFDTTSPDKLPQFEQHVKEAVIEGVESGEITIEPQPAAGPWQYDEPPKDGSVGIFILIETSVGRKEVFLNTNLNEWVEIGGKCFYRFDRYRTLLEPINHKIAKYVNWFKAWAIINEPEGGGR